MLNLYFEKVDNDDAVLVRKITEDDKLLTEFDESTDSIDFTILKDKIGQEITIYHNNVKEDTQVLKDIHLNDELKIYELIFE